MAGSEFFDTAWQLLGLGLLLGLGALFSRASPRFGVPIFLLFLALGMLAGSEGVGGIEFEDYRLSFHLGTMALVLILFDGGLNTSLSSLRGAWGPATVLATIGVLGTAGLLALAAWLLGFPWPHALLLGAIVASTDAAAVFSVLRASGVQLRRRVGAILELESGLNDPMAVLLTLALTASLLGAADLDSRMLLEVPLQLGLGAAFGCALGFAGRLLLRKVRLPAAGLYPVVTVSLALLAFGVATLLHGSGLLAVYATALVLGHGDLPYRTGVLRFHDALAWCAQVGMFLLFGLLVFPSRLLEVALIGTALGLVLALVARPIAAFACLAPFRLPRRETALVAWVGLRGAVPIILGIFPVLEGVAGAERLFDVVFFIVVVSALVPGGTVAWATRRLGLVTAGPPPPQAVLEISSTQPLDGESLSFHVASALPVCGVPIADIPFPEGTHAMLIVRGGQLLAPRGDTELRPGDHVYVFCRRQDRQLVELLFGSPEE
jgi:cell volume regulation protein A